jgi:hypothetical protein
VFTDALRPAHTNRQTTDFTIFQPNGQPFFRLSPAQAATFSDLYERMHIEQAANYPYKYELQFHLLMELVYGALKLQSEATGLR